MVGPAVADLEKNLEKLYGSQPLVFSHNDLNYANVIYNVNEKGGIKYTYYNNIIELLLTFINLPFAEAVISLVDLGMFLYLLLLVIIIYNYQHRVCWI